MYCNYYNTNSANVRCDGSLIDNGTVKRLRFQILVLNSVFLAQNYRSNEAPESGVRSSE